MALRYSPPRSDLAAPPVVPWRTWEPRFLRTWGQGDHVLLTGPTQSGKSLLARRLVVDGRKYVIVFGTKAKDPTLEGYLGEGFTRIDHWPPERRDFKDQGEGMARFVLWPKITKAGDLHRYRELYAKCLDAIFVDGGWTVVVDETLWFCSRDGLDLGGKLGTMAFGAASNKVSMLFLMQRPAGVPRILWQSCTTALLFHLGVTNDIREMASLGTVQPKAVVEAIGQLRGHQFLDLPCRGGAEWSVSEVSL
jgi:hypothetical protein